MLKREPVQASSEELEGDNTELEQKELLRKELKDTEDVSGSEQKEKGKVSDDTTEDDDSAAK